MAVTNPPATSDVKHVTNPNMTCFNCSKKGHSETECRELCKFYLRVKCADKMICFKKNRATNRKATKALKADAALESYVSQSADLACSSNATLLSPSSPHFRVDTTGLIDTGCNSLCLKKNLISILSLYRVIIVLYLSQTENQLLSKAKDLFVIKRQNLCLNSLMVSFLLIHLLRRIIWVSFKENYTPRPST